MSILFIASASVAILWFIFLGYHAVTWARGNGQKASWHLGRIFVDLVFIGFFVLGAVATAGG